MAGLPLSNTLNEYVHIMNGLLLLLLLPLHSARVCVLLLFPILCCVCIVSCPCCSLFSCVVSCPALPCCFLFYCVVLYHVLSCCFLLCCVMCHVSCCVVSCRVVSCRVLCLIVSCCVSLFLVVSCDECMGYILYNY